MKPRRRMSARRPARRSRRWRAAVATVVVVAASLAATRARADEQVGEKTYSTYEKETIERALAERHEAIDPSPSGKFIEEIQIVRLPVIEDRDPVPNFLNVFHATSRDRVIRREVLVQVGQRWNQALVDETARNLRDLPQLSIVLCLAVQGSAPDRVKLLVVTKDVWSIRLNNNFQYAGGKLQYLLVQPTEENLIGSHHVVYGEFVYDPGTYSFGGGYTIPRLDGTRVRAAVSGGVIVNHAGGLEGGYGELQYGQPLYSTQAKWAWGLDVSFRQAVFRRFVGGNLALYDAAATPYADNIPYMYHVDSEGGTYSVTRSFGDDIKHDFTVGLTAKRNVYRHYDLSAFDPAAAQEFVDQLPVSDTQIGPSFGYRTYSTTFQSVLDFETLALQEDYRLGHDIYFTLTPITKALRSTRNFLGLSAGAQYTFPVGDGLLRGIATTNLELADDIPDAEVAFRVHFISPSLHVGHLVFDAVWDERPHDYLNTYSVLGGDTRPRGYPTQAFLGKDAAAYTLEFRSKPVEILSCELAGAAFFDAGDAFNGPENMLLKYSAGFGARALFPQLERTVVRLDVAFPFQRMYAAGPVDVVATFDQAFDFPSVD